MPPETIRIPCRTAGKPVPPPMATTRRGDEASRPTGGPGVDVRDSVIRESMDATQSRKPCAYRQPANPTKRSGRQSKLHVLDTKSLRPGWFMGEADGWVNQQHAGEVSKAGELSTGRVQNWAIPHLKSLPNETFRSPDRSIDGNPMKTA